MSRAYDAIVVGAGHNGLTTAGLLAAGGRSVVLVERRERVGGIAAGEEFHPGYRSAGVLHDTSGVRPAAVRALELEKHGLQMRASPADVLALGRPGEGLLLGGDVDRTREEIGRFSEADAAQYARYRKHGAKLRRILDGFLHEPPLDVVDIESNAVGSWTRWGLRLARVGRGPLIELMRLPPMCVADWLGEWFETDLLKASLALPALASSYVGPRAPGTNVNLLLHEAARGPGVARGAAGLVEALTRAAGAAGVEIRTGTAVRAIHLDADRVRGVVLEDGETLESPIVAAACDPKHALLDLLPRACLPNRIARGIRAFRTRGTTAQVLLALSRPPSFPCRQGLAVEFASTGASLDDIERAFDAVKYRRISEAPALEVHVPTVSSPELAPDGHAVLSALVHCAPHDLESGWDTAERERLGDLVLSTLEPHAPGLTESVVAREVLTPVDLEARYGLTGGNLYHGEHALDQLLLRPAPRCVGYRAPVAGMFLCGSGSHPGGGITCAPGLLAARSIARNRT